MCGQSMKTYINHLFIDINLKVEYASHNPLEAAVKSLMFCGFYPNPNNRLRFLVALVFQSFIVCAPGVFVYQNCRNPYLDKNELLTAIVTVVVEFYTTCLGLLIRLYIHQKIKTWLHMLNQLDFRYYHVVLPRVYIIGVLVYTVYFTMIHILVLVYSTVFGKTIISVIFPIKSIWIINILEILGLYANTLVGITAVSTFSVTFFTISSHLERLNIQFAKVKTRNGLHNAVKYHQHVIRTFLTVFDGLQGSFRVFYITQISFFSGFLLALTTNFNIFMLSVLLVFFIEAFLLNLVGQIVIDKCVVLQNCVFEVAARTSHLKLRKDLIFVLHRTQSPLLFKIIPFGALQYESMLKLYKFTYTLYMTLKHVAK